jgi:3-methyladenine DNA glycosylase Tag
MPRVGEAPPQIDAQTPADFFEVITRAVFQSGFSWPVIAAKWDGFRAAFAGFDPAAVAAFTPDEVDRLCSDERIVRNRRKIEATVHNAEVLLELDEAHGGFRAYLGSHGGFDAASADLQRCFKWLGGLGAYYVLYVVKEPVPPFEEWRARQGA